MLDHRAPLDQVWRERRAQTIALPGLHVAPVAGRGRLLLQSEPGEALLHDAALKELGLRVPGPRATSLRGDYALLWMTPKEWLLELPALETAAVKTALVSRLASALAAVTDVSDALAGFDVGGDRAVEVLMSGCSLDLRPEAFAAARVARTAVADVPVIIWKPDDSRPFRCLVDRGFTQHLWSWFAESPAR